MSRGKAQRDIALQRAQAASGLTGNAALAVLPPSEKRPQPLLVVHSDGTLHVRSV